MRANWVFEAMKPKHGFKIVQTASHYIQLGKSEDCYSLLPVLKSEAADSTEAINACGICFPLLTAKSVSTASFVQE